MQLKSYVRAYEDFPDPVLLCDPAGVIVSANRALEAATGLREAALRGESIFSLLLPAQDRPSDAGATDAVGGYGERANGDVESASGVEEAFDPQLLKTRAANLGLWCRRKIGQPFPVEISISRLPCEPDVDPVCLVLKDISVKADFLQFFGRLTAQPDAREGASPREEAWFARLLETGSTFLGMDAAFIVGLDDGRPKVLGSLARGSAVRGLSVASAQICAALAAADPEKLAIGDFTRSGDQKAGFISELEGFPHYLAMPVRFGGRLLGLLVFLSTGKEGRTLDAFQKTGAEIMARMAAGMLVRRGGSGPGAEAPNLPSPVTEAGGGNSDEDRSSPEDGNAQVEMEPAEPQAGGARTVVSEGRYRTLFQSIPAMLVYLDQKQCFADVTDQFVEHFGRSRKSLIGRVPGDIMVSSSRERAERSGRMMNRRGARVRNEPYEVIAGDGTVIDVEVTANRQDDGSILCSVIDVSDRNRARSQLETRNLDLERLNENLRHFNAIAAHDMQEPLRKIRYFSDLLGRALKENNREDVDYSLSVLGDAARRASVLVTDLLEFSRASNKEFLRESIDLRELLRGIVMEISREPRGRKASIRLDLPRLLVFGDRTAIVQMFRNFVDNALKYRHPDRAVAIDITAEVDAGTGAPARIRLQDNGIGFPSEYAEKIMKPFSRLHRRNQYPGSGVGLAICSVVAERHGWDIKAEGQPGEGARFEVAIPDYALA